MQPIPPISDPNAKPPRHFAGAEVREFRVRFWLCGLMGWLLIWVIVVVGISLFGVIVVLFDRPNAYILRAIVSGYVLETMALTAVYAMLISAWEWRFLPLKVGSWGLRSHTVWRAPQEVAWSEITRARYFWFVYPYLIISCAGRPKLWVYFVLEKPGEFARSVAAQTAPDHPLHAFLIGRGLLESS